MLSNFGAREKKKSNPPSFLTNKAKFTPLPIPSVRSNLVALIPAEWEAALSEECKCKFTLDQIRQNAFLLQLTWFYCLLKLCTNFWESLKASIDFHGTIFKMLKTFFFFLLPKSFLKPKCPRKHRMGLTPEQTNRLFQNFNRFFVLSSVRKGCTTKIYSVKSLLMNKSPPENNAIDVKFNPGPYLCIFFLNGSSFLTERSEKQSWEKKWH